MLHTSFSFLVLQNVCLRIKSYCLDSFSAKNTKDVSLNKVKHQNLSILIIDKHKL